MFWFNSIKATQPYQWLVHILLYMGHFDNELNLFSKGSLHSAFQHAKPINHNVNWFGTEICDITMKYIVD